jgi:hypothetical protein
MNHYRDIRQIGISIKGLRFWDVQNLCHVPNGPLVQGKVSQVAFQRTRHAVHCGGLSNDDNCFIMATSNQPTGGIIYRDHIMQTEVFEATIK